MTGELFLRMALNGTFAILILSFLLIILRIVRGPTLPDRILALDLLVAVVIGFIAAFGIRSGFTVYVDIAIALGLVGFLSTVALARFVMGLGDPPERGGANRPVAADAKGGEEQGNARVRLGTNDA